MEVAIYTIGILCWFITICGLTLLTFDVTDAIKMSLVRRRGQIYEVSWLDVLHARKNYYNIVGQHPFSFSKFIGPMTDLDDQCFAGYLVTEEGKRRIELLLGPDSVTLLKAYMMRGL